MPRYFSPSVAVVNEGFSSITYSKFCAISMKAIDFCIIIFYPATYLSVPIVYDSFPMESLGFFVCAIIFAANGVNFTSF